MTPDHSRRGSRRKAREKALQLLFQIEATGDSVEDACARYWAQFPAGEDARQYAQRLVDLAAAHREDIDATLAAAAEHWSLDRMNPVDRALLRMAICELRYIDDVPPKVTINEAIEIAKEFSSLDSSKFVNGVLDRVFAESRSVTE